MLVLLVAHVVVALGAPVLVRRLGRRAFYVLALVPAAVALWALTWTSRVVGGQAATESATWIADLDLRIAFRVDTLSWVMTVIVGSVGALVLVYCASYFSKGASGMGRFATVFMGFSGAMVGLVTADDLIALFVFWELTTVTSYLLIGHYSDRKTSRRAAMEAIVVTTAGGLAMLVGLVLIGTQAGTWQLSQIVADPPARNGTMTTAVVLVLAGALTKSALVPFHFWLPAAMAAPTPVSAYLHAAAMVKAGVYLVARFAPAFADYSAWRWVVLVAGATTVLLGGYRALRQNDLKLVLAFGTVSQLGLIVLLVGYGTRATALAGMALLGAHAMFKAALFLVVGVVDRAASTRDLRSLSGVGRELPWTAAIGAVAVASMVGLPPTAGYVSKEAALAALADDGTTGAVLLVTVAVGSVLTVAYGLRFWWGAFGNKSNVLVAGPDGTSVLTPSAEAPKTLNRPSVVLSLPAGLLALLGLVAGLFPGLAEHVLVAHPDTYPGSAGHLSLWGGPSVTAITVGVLSVGLGLFIVRDQVERLQAKLWHPVSADRLYRRGMRGLDDLAADITGAVQRGSLPGYLAMILVVFVVGVGSLLVTTTSLPKHVRAFDSLGQVALGAVVVVSTVLVARSRRRLKAAILLGISGYAVAGLFLAHGAPDLALTQVLVETVTLVVFVLVLRRLPTYFSVRPLAASRWLRLALGVAVGLVVGGLALVAGAAPVEDPIAKHFPEQALDWGHGRNVVNVTLVDIRAWDTVGEISVLLVAATGVASMVFLRRRTGPIFRADDAAAEPAVWGHDTDPPAPQLPEPDNITQRNARWLAAVTTLAPRRRSVVFEVVTRLLFHTIIVYALYLLFSGHNAPGGGFVAGLVTGIALTVRYLAAGRYELGEAAPVQPGALLGAGLFIAAGTGVVSMMLGAPVLTSTVVALQLPAIGHVDLVTSLFFDFGVYLVVVGLVLDILRTLGAEMDRRAESGDDGPFGAPARVP
ncbi:MAG: Na+/H+ antiporter subunit A, partial [Micrococcales bacterium]|nr:Na+/H+ antiporter subunit A [Micrococcales bacterium]